MKRNIRESTRGAELRTGRIRSSEERRRSRPVVQAFEAIINSRNPVGLIVDGAGIVQFVRVFNPAPLQEFVATLKGQSLLDMLYRRTYEPLVERSLRSFQTGQPDDLERIFELPDRSRWLSVTISRMKSGAIPNKILSVFVQDLDGRARIAERLKTSQTLLDHAEKLAGIGTWEADLHEGHFAWSEQLLRVLQLDREQTTEATAFLWKVVGRCVEVLEPLDRRRKVNEVELEVAYVPPGDEAERLLLTRTVAKAHTSGPALHFVGIIRDITEQRRDETRLRESEALLAQSEELANTGSWEYDTGKRTFLWSAHFRRMLGCEPGSGPIHQSEACRLLHEDDRLRIWNDAQQVVAGRTSVENEGRFTLPGGHTRILHSRAVGVKDSSGRITKIRGVSQDVTERRSEEERLQKSEALLAQAEQLANLGSWDLDVRAGTSMWSGELFRLLGLRGSEEPRIQAYWDNLHEEDRPRVRETLANAILDGKQCEYVARYRLPAGAWRIHQTRALPIRGADGETAHLIGIIQDITDQKRAEEKQHQLSQTLMRLRDDERRHMARELHESAGQTLAALKMSLGNLREALPKGNSRAHGLIGSCRELAEEVVREVRTVSYLMHPPLLDEAGLSLAVRWYARGLSERSKIQVDVIAADDFGRLPQEVEMTLFRIIQEALTNVHRHSGSRVAKIRLIRKAGQVQDEIEDEGSGFAAADATGGESIGVGIAGMRERVMQLNGTFEIQTVPGRGTLVRATLNALPICRDPMVGPPTIGGVGGSESKAKGASQ